MGATLAGRRVRRLAGTKTGRRIGKSALVYRGAAVLSRLERKAWRDWRNGKPAPVRNAAATVHATPLPPPPSGSAFVPQTGHEAGLNRALIRAMIRAAQADCQIDTEARQPIFHYASGLGGVLFRWVLDPGSVG